MPRFPLLPILLLRLIVLLVLGTAAGVGAGQRLPNILWLSCEDISPHLGCYGDPHAITPNLDRLAENGVRYTHAFTAAGVCAPCRSTIITGLYQNSQGTHHMRCNASLPGTIRPFPLLLREAGYHCTNNSKTDYQFSKPRAGDIWDASSSKAHWRDRPEPETPFFAVFNFTGCHESGIASESKYRKVTENLTPDQRQDPSVLSTLPPYYPDTPVVREDWKRNYELITAMDAWAGEHLRALEEAGLAENTIVFFWSDHGVGLPRAKRWLYDSGTRVPFIVRIPEAFREPEQGIPGSVADELISSVDFGATVLNLAGVPIPEVMQGRAFLGAKRSQPHQYVFGARDRMDERYDIIRAVRGKRYRYIRNFEPLKPYYQYMNTPEKGATMREIRRIEASGDVPAPGALFTAERKPVEELYDLESDPHELNNLAEDPAQAERLATMREALAQWQFEVRDIGLLPESEIELREAEVGARYDILRQEGSEAMLKTLIRVATQASDGPDSVPALKTALGHDDAAVRYWGATGLGNFAAEAEPARETLLAALEDEAPCVRIAAGRALCRMGEEETVAAGLKVLRAELSGRQQWARLKAAIALDELDEVARPALPELEAALEDQPNKYIVRVANRAVNDLLGTARAVP